MLRLHLIIPIFAVLGLACAPAAPPCPTEPTTTAVTVRTAAPTEQAEAALGFLKSLEGTWTVTDKNKSSKATFEIVGGGTTVVQKSGFMAVYHLDEAEVKMLLFPDDGYQAVMKSKGLVPSGEKTAEVHFVFDFASASNMPANAGRPKRVAFTKSDADHITQTWTWRDPRGETSFTLTFERDKSPAPPSPAP